MSGAEKLIDVAFSGLEERRKILSVQELHAQRDLPTDYAANYFVINHAQHFAQFQNVKNFVELPYWMNSIIYAHGKGALSNREFKEYMDEVSSAADPSLLVTMRAKINALNEVDIPTYAFDVRYEDPNKLPEGLKKVYAEAEKLAERYPESVRHQAFIREALRTGIPADSVAAALVTDILGAHGKGIIVYGTSHMNGSCSSEYNIHGILDDALERQGAKVTDGIVATNRENLSPWTQHFENMKKLITGELGSLSKYNCRFTIDERDYVYFEEGDELLNKNGLIQQGIKDFFRPSDGLPMPKNAFDPHQLDPLLIERFRNMVKESHNVKETEQQRPLYTPLAASSPSRSNKSLP